MTSQVAQTIAAQIGNKAFTMLGASQLVGGDDMLQFKIKGSRKANCIRVTLGMMDLYSVEFFKIRGLDCSTVSTVNGVYADQLHSVIESATGLATSL